MRILQWAVTVVKELSLAQLAHLEPEGDTQWFGTDLQWTELDFHTFLRPSSTLACTSKRIFDHGEALTVDSGGTDIVGWLR